MKIPWKKLAQVGLAIGKQFFPILGLVEDFAFTRNISSKEKQDMAVKMLRSQIIASLLPNQAEIVVNDPRFEIMLRNMIDGGVALNNLVAEILANNVE